MRLPIEQHKMKHPNLERNLFIVVMIALLALTGFATTAIQKERRDRARVQQLQEQKAVLNRHAVEVRP